MAAAGNRDLPSHVILPHIRGEHPLTCCPLQAAEQLGLPRICSIQNAYSLLSRVPYETDLAEVCAPRQCNVGLLAYSPLAGGSLSGKYIEGGKAVEKARLNIFPGERSVHGGRGVGSLVGCADITGRQQQRHVPVWRVPCQACHALMQATWHATTRA
jgi:hypothetical protein